MDRMDWNSSELRAGVDKWPEAQATVTDIEQPYNDGKHDFLSVITYTFKDNVGEYWEGKYETRTIDLPTDLMEGAEITIRYNPKNPRKSWCEQDYYRSGFGRFQSFDYPITLMVMVGVFLLLIAVIKIFHIRIR
jgi:hypothetical protein